MKFTYQTKAALCAASLALAAACTSSPDKTGPAAHKLTPLAAAEKEVMDRHDSLMAKTDQLYALKAEISAAHSPASPPFVHGLLAADAAMMTWMHEFQAPDSTAGGAARLAYFEQQKQVLARISRQYRATMDSAAMFISQHGEGNAPATSK